MYEVLYTFVLFVDDSQKDNLAERMLQQTALLVKKSFLIVMTRSIIEKSSVKLQR